MSTGDRPLFLLPNQRLDKVDVYAISELKEELLQRMWVDIMGPGYGLLSDVELSYSAPTLTIGACRVGYGEATTGIGGSVRHDPDIAGSGLLNLTAVAGVTGWIGFKRAELPADEENRAYWDALANQKKVGPTNTRSREYIQLACNTNKTTLLADGYYPFLYVSGWVADVPAIVKVHYYDGAAYNGTTYGLNFQHGSTSPATITYTSRGEAAFASYSNRSSAHYLRLMSAAMNRMTDSNTLDGTGWQYSTDGSLNQAGAVGWNTNPALGITQLGAFARTHDRQPHSVVTGYVQYDGVSAYVTEVFQSPDFTPTVTVVAGNVAGSGGNLGGPIITVTINNTPAPWVITGVLAQAYQSIEMAAAASPHIAAIGISYDELPLVGDSATDLVFTAGVRIKSNTSNESYDYAIGKFSFSIIALRDYPV